MSGAVRRAVLIVVFAVAIGGCTGGGQDAPSNLKVGDCFDVPTSQEIAALPTKPCTQPHGGEVFHTFDTTGESAAYPSDEAWGQLIFPVCDPVFNTYTGTPVEERTDIDYLYIVPTGDRWAHGDRRITCFIHALDGAPLRHSYRDTG
jgi:hypothetical protein